ncbi:alpha-glucosidase family protein [Sansalvadorimonas sp. 2012CJ34-2]|uniref:Alpha-glucosidase family protein n=1 Tax=Parendozoicomonas callyspongiae TaxID=2942213 RepID=A0ABT0PJ70_9GAMM|nr:alpha-glucosidase family protein [Sansalvadorimonas sp. 2012CJ34-2]MCL6270787.1 alpha-glucosidase family protein [Sansalvadorimonas sp. 2012CJ34-2]
MNSDSGLNKQESLRGNLVSDPDWWRGAVIYQIYPRSFADSNGDGIGDLKGITGKLSYIAELGADAIWISPFCKSPMDDFGYDVSDYKDVDPIFGNLADFQELVIAAHKFGLRVMTDLVISHTSGQHKWFQESRQNKTNSKADWYVWADPKPDGSMPNNWLSIFGGSAWQWEPRREQYYLHNFLRSQPDLNFHNPDVQDAVLDAARFWLDLGVDGFRLDTVNFYFHDQQLRNNPPLEDRTQLTTMESCNPYGYQNHLYDKTRPENLHFLKRLRSLLDEYPDTTMVGEVGADQDTGRVLREYTSGDSRLHMAYSFELLSGQPTPAHIRDSVEILETSIGEGWLSYAMSNHDVVRAGTRAGEDVDSHQAAPVFIAVTSCLRGSPCIYQGEELGFTEADVAFEDLQDPYGIEFWPEFKGRDGCRTPIAWEESEHGGFSAGKPWLPVAKEHIEYCVERQRVDSDLPLQKVKNFLNWRKGQNTLKKGSIKFVESGSEQLLSFVRTNENEKLLCVFNLSDSQQEVALDDYSCDELLSGHGFKATVAAEKLILPAWQAAWLRLV